MKKLMLNKAKATICLIVMCLLLVQGCKKDNYESSSNKYNKLDPNVARIAKWYDDETKGSINKDFILQNQADWINTDSLIQDGNSVLYSAPLYHKDSIFRELNIDQVNGKYFGLIKEYILHKEKETSLKVYSLNGNLIKTGFLNFENKFVVTQSADLLSIKRLILGCNDCGTGESTGSGGGTNNNHNGVDNDETLHGGSLGGVTITIPPPMPQFPPINFPVLPISFPSAPIANPIGSSTGGRGKNYGVDPNCHNCQIKSADFDSFLAEAKTAGLVVDIPYKTTITTADGKTYEGTMTTIRNTDGNLVAGYFKPDVSSDKFTIGNQYNLGNGKPNGSTTTNNSGVSYYGIGGQIIEIITPYRPGDGIMPIVYLPNFMGITDLDKQNFLIANIEIYQAFKDYLRLNGDTPENKAFVEWSIGYLIANPNVNFEEFKSEYLDYTLNPPNFNDVPIIDNGIELEDAPVIISSGPKPVIGSTTNRNNIEDMTYGTNHDATGVNPLMLTKSDANLFISMNNLMDFGTLRDAQLKQVTHEFVEIFKTNASPNTIATSPILNQKVEVSPVFANFIKRFGAELQKRLKETSGEINNISIQMENIRPVFNGKYNMVAGLTILLNDTEQSTVRLESYDKLPNDKFIAVIEVTIMDHFGLDKHDVLSKQHIHDGFAAWWILQHNRGYIPFQTKVIARKTIIGHYN